MTQLENALHYLDQYHDEMLFLWETLVKTESPSADPAAIDLLASHLDTYCRALGMETEKLRPEGAGACLAAWTVPQALRHRPGKGRQRHPGGHPQGGGHRGPDGLRPCDLQLRQDLRRHQRQHHPRRLRRGYLHPLPLQPGAGRRHGKGACHLQQGGDAQHPLHSGAPHGLPRHGGAAPDRGAGKSLRDASEALGLGRPGTVGTAGCSDSAYTTSMGIPTLCAVGVLGEGQHSPNEHASISSLLSQAKRLTAAILALPDSF